MISAAVKTQKGESFIQPASELTHLLANGTVSGAQTGTWQHQGNNLVAITLASGGLWE